MLAKRLRKWKFTLSPQQGMSSLLDDLLILPTPILLLLTPLNLALLLCLSVLVYNLLPALPATTALPTQPTAYNWRPAAYAPTLLWRDYIPKELAAFNGIKSDSNPQSRILFAIRRKVYDVTAGKNFYGPGKRIHLQFYPTFHSFSL